MRVLFVESYPQVMMGQQRTLLALLAQCEKNNISPVVACTSDGTFTNTVQREGYETVVLPYPSKINVYGGEIYRYGLLDKAKMYCQVLQYIFQLKKKLKELNVEVVYCNDMLALLTVGVAAKWLGVPVVIWDKLDKPHGWLDIIQLPLVSKNIIISESVKCKYPQCQNKKYAHKIIKIHDGAYIDRIDNSKCIREELGFTQSDILVGIVGTVNLRKGYDRFIDIVENISKLNIR